METAVEHESQVALGPGSSAPRQPTQMRLRPPDRAAEAPAAVPSPMTRSVSRSAVAGLPLLRPEAGTRRFRVAGPGYPDLAGRGSEGGARGCRVVQVRT